MHGSEFVLSSNDLRRDNETAVRAAGFPGGIQIMLVMCLGHTIFCLVNEFINLVTLKIGHFDPFRIKEKLDFVHLGCNKTPLNSPLYRIQCKITRSTVTLTHRSPHE